MTALHADIAALKDSWRPLHQALGEIEVDMLKGMRSFCKIKGLLLTAWKACTRKEEIARFSKAINNPDFTRMLRTRNLGPEHLEKQSRLRKQVRVWVPIFCYFTLLTSYRPSATG